jgi:16S rRNA (adenine1518-N6/adenine1519-N6)-dimethyltransferase
MLRQSLKGVPGALDALAALGIEATRRAETISVDQFVQLAQALSPR